MYEKFNRKEIINRFSAIIHASDRPPTRSGAQHSRVDNELYQVHLGTAENPDSLKYKIQKFPLLERVPFAGSSIQAGKWFCSLICQVRLAVVHTGRNDYSSNVVGFILLYLNQNIFLFGHLPELLDRVLFVFPSQIST